MLQAWIYHICEVQIVPRGLYSEKHPNRPTGRHGFDSRWEFKSTMLLNGKLSDEPNPTAALLEIDVIFACGKSTLLYINLNWLL